MKQPDPELEGKNFFQKWKIGLKRIDAAQMMDAKISNHFGALGAIVLIMVTFLLKIDYSNITDALELRTLGFALFMLFLGGLQVVEMINTYKKKLELVDEIKLYKNNVGELNGNK